MQVRYINDPDIRNFVRKTAALAFIPVRYVHLAWQAVKAEAPEDTGIADFATYFKKNMACGTLSTFTLECF